MYGGLVDSGAAGLVLLSSGTTGEPKAILHDFDTLIAQKLERRATRSGSASSILMMLLFDHIGGVNTLLNAILVGRPAVIPTERTPEEVCRLIEKHRVRLLPTSPTFLNLMLLGRLHEVHDLGSLRLITYGTEPMPAELLRRISAALPQARLLQTFGTSETGISTTVSESSRSTRFKIDDPDVQHRIVDGELQLRTRTQFLGYLNQETTTVTEDGWFRTGDLVEQDQDGYLTITGRLRDVINVGGQKVLPLELESILLSSPLVEDCAVYGKPNAITGQSVWVDVRTAPGLSKAEARQHVKQFLAERVERFKVPTRVNVVDSVGVSDRFKKKRGPA
jgi:acyl-coenzyme A synthetase/AMP-(fatty) acid ligase